MPSVCWVFVLGVLGLAGLPYLLPLMSCTRVAAHVFGWFGSQHLSESPLAPSRSGFLVPACCFSLGAVHWRPAADGLFSSGPGALLPCPCFADLYAARLSAAILTAFRVYSHKLSWSCVGLFAGWFCRSCEGCLNSLGEIQILGPSR